MRLVGVDQLLEVNFFFLLKYFLYRFVFLLRQEVEQQLKDLVEVGWEKALNYGIDQVLLLDLVAVHFLRLGIILRSLLLPS